MERQDSSDCRKCSNSDNVRSLARLTRISHRLTAEAPDRPAITSLRLLAVLNVLSRTPPFVKRRAPRTDAPLTHFASPRGEKSGLSPPRPAGPRTARRPGATARAAAAAHGPRLGGRSDTPTGFGFGMDVPSCRPSAPAWSRGNTTARAIAAVTRSRAPSAGSRDSAASSPALTSSTSCSPPSSTSPSSSRLCVSVNVS